MTKHEADCEYADSGSERCRTDLDAAHQQPQPDHNKDEDQWIARQQRVDIDLQKSPRTRISYAVWS